MPLFQSRRIPADFWRTVWLSIIFGALAGALGAAALWSYLLAYRTSLMLAPTPILTERAREPTSHSEARRVSREQVVPALASIFMVPGASPERYLEEEAVGQGIVLTADGWILSHESVFDPRRFAEVRVGAGPFVVAPEHAIHDEETGAVFLKIPATNLRAAQFGRSTELPSGDELVALSGAGRFSFVRLDEVRMRAGSRGNSDVLETRMTIAEELAPAFAGGPLVDLRGAIVGLLVAGPRGAVSSAVPIDQLSPSFPGLFSDTVIRRPLLGVRGIDLASSWEADGGRSRGFLVTPDLELGIRAFAPGSPAAGADLREGDIILKVNDVALDGILDLAELLLASKPGETIDLEVRRGTGTETVTITLGERESSQRYE